MDSDLYEVIFFSFLEHTGEYTKLCYSKIIVICCEHLFNVEISYFNILNLQTVYIYSDG